MRAVIQRVSKASVCVGERSVGRIGQGYLVLLGCCNEDTDEDISWLSKKIVNLRVFDDAEGVMNRSIKDVDGDILVVSQFTLWASYKKGNRPSFTDAGRPEMAEPMYEYILEACRKEIPVVEQGEFGADMKVALVNDGPFTVVLDSRDLM